jgi:hypothetical protein
LPVDLQDYSQDHPYEQSMSIAHLRNVSRDLPCECCWPSIRLQKRWNSIAGSTLTALEGVI